MCLIIIITIIFIFGSVRSGKGKNTRSAHAPPSKLRAGRAGLAHGGWTLPGGTEAFYFVRHLERCHVHSVGSQFFSPCVLFYFLKEEKERAVFDSQLSVGKIC